MNYIPLILWGSLIQRKALLWTQLTYDQQTKQEEINPESYADKKRKGFKPTSYEKNGNSFSTNQNFGKYVSMLTIEGKVLSHQI